MTSEHRDATAELVAMLTASNEGSPGMAGWIFTELSQEAQAQVMAIACGWLLAAIAERGSLCTPPVTVAEFLREIAAINVCSEG